MKPLKVCESSQCTFFRCDKDISKRAPRLDLALPCCREKYLQSILLSFCQSHIFGYTTTRLLQFCWLKLQEELKKNGVIQREKHSDIGLSFYHILEYIDAHSAEPLEVRQLAEMCHMSYSNFARLFRENYGRSCKEYIKYIRLNKAQDLLLNSDYDLDYIAQKTGFFDCSHFIRTYKKWRGITPKQEHMRNMEVVW